MTTPQLRAILRGAQQLHNAFGHGVPQIQAYATLVLRIQAMTSDGMGGQIPSGAPTDSDPFEGVIRQLGATASEREILAQLGTATGYVIHAPLGLAIDPAGQVVETVSGRVFEIRGVSTPMPAVDQQIVAVEIT